MKSEGPNRIAVLLSAGLGDAFWEEKVRIDPADPMKVAEAGIGPADRPPEFAIPRMPRAQLHAAVARKLASDVAADRFSGTVMVARHGEVIYRSAAGLADRKQRTPVTADTKLRIGSANKMFTAIGVLQLVDKGRVALDAPIGTYLKDYPNAAFGKSVTVRQLLSHTGGAGDIFTPEYEKKRLQVRTLADYVELFGDRAPETGDGRNAYSNYGFVRLGRIIEAVSGEDYYRYVDRNIFVPAEWRTPARFRRMWGFPTARGAIPARTGGLPTTPTRCRTEARPRAAAIPRRRTSSASATRYDPASCFPKRR